ncbi:hypothetical protein [Nostoc sp. CHAB 5715]|uniref:hypothetical protein n=1 Tax=Nostoc sp. CHAB 5715 TaxID=2780400 RepID=UPI001E523C9A|nr:hypothetical protein [Nostoc sp. CHAB 5715]
MPQVLQYWLKITLVLLGIGHWALGIGHPFGFAQGKWALGMSYFSLTSLISLTSPCSLISLISPCPLPPALI